MSDPILDSALRLVHASETLGDPISHETLKPSRRKSAVFRVHTRQGSSIVVKCCRPETGRIEARIYASVLERIGVFAPALLDYREYRGSSWLFLEDVVGEPYSSRNPAHRQLAGAWMARLHETAASEIQAVDLPSRGVDYWNGLLQCTRGALEAARGNPHWPDNGTSVLDRLERALDSLEASWQWISDLADSFPTTLVHGGFAGKNVVVCISPSGLRVAAFDWEAGGWGTPFPDLSMVSLSAYRGGLGPSSPFHGVPLEACASLGAVFWHIAPIHGEGRALTSRWPNRVAGKLEYYANEIERHLRILEPHMKAQR